LAGRRDPARQRARRRATAYPRARNALRHLGKTARPGAVLGEPIADVLRHYIADKYEKTAQSLTPADSAALLENERLDSDLVQRFCSVFEQCDHSRYAGDSAEQAPTDIAELIALLAGLDKGIAK